MTGELRQLYRDQPPRLPTKCELEQIRTADVLLATHGEQIPVCSCGRPSPRTVEASITKPRQHHIDQLAQHGAARVTARVRVGAAVGARS